MMRFTKLLVPTDFSEASLAAVKYATSVGMCYSSTLYVLYVVEHVRQGHEEPAVRDAQRRLMELVARALSGEVNVVPVVRAGHAAEVITRFALDEGIDLVIMATHGRTGLRHILLGSVAERVVRCSTVPVMTVKPPKLRDVFLYPEDVEQELHLP
jgi:nucleotide-binding universal stress UspA family protein